MSLLKKYLFWTYERGCFHYDVMVTLILAFLFITPQLWNYGDRPAERRLTASEVLVKRDGNGFVYQIDADQVKVDGQSLDMALERTIEPISGAVVIGRYETVKDASGRVTAYKVWAHR
jgi:hypothetical protein